MTVPQLKAAGCHMREILKMRLSADRQVYIDSLTSLQGRSGRDLVRADKLAERARLAYEVAKSKYHDHVVVHGCEDHWKYSQ